MARLNLSNIGLLYCCGFNTVFAWGEQADNACRRTCIRPWLIQCFVGQVVFVTVNTKQFLWFVYCRRDGEQILSLGSSDKLPDVGTGRFNESSNRAGNTGWGAGTSVNNTPRFWICSVERRHQEMCTSLEMLATLGDSTDRLPVVELRPFTTKEWRPSKSRPTFYVRSQTAAGGWNTGNTTGPNRGNERRSGTHDNNGYPDPTKSSFSPRVEDGLFPKGVTIGAQRVSAHPRLREFKMADQPRETAFISKFEREKSTLGAINSGQSSSSQFSCLKRALTELDIAQHQHIRLYGRKMSTAPPGEQADRYSGLWEVYHSDPNRGQDSSPGSCSGTAERVSTRMEGYLDQCIYDAFDRSKTLPCINVKKARMKKRGAVKPSSRQSSERRSARTPAYKLGVTNSLDFLSHQGKPVGVEQQLAMELKHNLARLKRTKDGSATALKALGSKYDLGFPTMGEETIHRAMKSNARRRQRTSKSLPSSLSRAETSKRSDVYDSGFGSTQGERYARSQTSRYHNHNNVNSIYNVSSSHNWESMDNGDFFKTSEVKVVPRSGGSSQRSLRSGARQPDVQRASVSASDDDPDTLKEPRSEMLNAKRMSKISEHDQEMLIKSSAKPQTGEERLTPGEDAETIESPPEPVSNSDRDNQSVLEKSDQGDLAEEGRTTSCSRSQLDVILPSCSNVDGDSKERKGSEETIASEPDPTNVADKDSSDVVDRDCPSSGENKLNDVDTENHKEDINGEGTPTGDPLKASVSTASSASVFLTQDLQDGGVTDRPETDQEADDPNDLDEAANMSNNKESKSETSKSHSHDKPTDSDGDVTQPEVEDLNSEADTLSDSVSLPSRVANDPGETVENNVETVEEEQVETIVNHVETPEQEQARDVVDSVETTEQEQNHNIAKNTETSF